MPTPEPTPAPSPPPRVAVLIVNYNTADELARCLAALAAQTVAPARVIVVDNASQDHTRQVLAAAPLPVEAVFAGANLGFAPANNLAAARVDDCAWLALVNPDAYPRPTWLAELLDAARRRPEFRFFASRLVAADDPQLLDGTGDLYHGSGLACRRDHRRVGRGRALAEEEVFAPCAAAALYDHAAWQEAGGFDESYFCYFEDVDLAFRLRLLGHRCLYVPRAEALHQGSAASGVRSDFATYHGHRNLVTTFLKDMPGPLLWLYLPWHLAANLATVLWLARRGQGRVALQAKWHALRNLPHTLASRHTIQQKRRASATQIRRAFTTTREFFRHLNG
ncbi:MAG: glycosyltransferase family 2 protein [Deltaproteobacteria bacterium]|nr:glycosyltransferase family 2 protein [Deltaproteobacteria bacterium]